MTSTTQNLDEWLKKVQQAQSGDAVFKLLADFRKLDWTDEELSRMSKVYMRVLNRVGGASSTVTSSQEEEEGPDGPVWYEKM